MFHTFKQHLAQHFQSMTAYPLFVVEINQDLIWEKYLAGFVDPTIKQEHTCNSCKSFLRQYGGIVALDGTRLISLWDNLTVPEVYDAPVRALSEYVHAQPIADIFLTTEQRCGTDKNFDRQRSITWEHFALTVPRQYVQPSISLDTLRSKARSNKQVLQRSLDELTMEATETVLALIGDNALYRGKEQEGFLQAFYALQGAYRTTDTRKYFCWPHSAPGSAVTRIRNTAIGTLLIDLSAGTDLESAVAKYERVVAPMNYKRPSAAVTPKMVEQARATLAQLELLDSLERRYAEPTDLSVENVLFTHRPAATQDVFTAIAQEAVVNPHTLRNTEAIGIEAFLTTVVPTAQRISVLLENHHLSNLMTLVTAQDATVPLLFKWDNPFSWSYTGGITDAITERVKEAGGQIDGELRVSLAWHNYDDLDLHVHEPDGNHIYFPSKRTQHPSSGMLDVDMNAGRGRTRTPVENIIWTDRHRMPEGPYVIRVRNFTQRESTGVGFVVQVVCHGEVWEFAYPKSPKDQEYQDIVTCTYSRAHGVSIHGEQQSRVVQRQKWGLTTYRWQTVSTMLLSPNYWHGQRFGNKHYLFMLDGCVADEAPRPFYNEFLKRELEVHRKVFEILGSKVEVTTMPTQLSGVGFSETKRAQLLVRVERNKTSRVMRVTF